MASTMNSRSPSDLSRANTRTPPPKDTANVEMTTGRIRTFFRQFVSGGMSFNRKRIGKQPAVRGVYHVFADNCPHKDSSSTASPSSAGHYLSSPGPLGTRSRSNSQSESNSEDVDTGVTLWTPSNSPDHHKDTPVIVRRPQYEKLYNELDDDKLLRRIIHESRKLPQAYGKSAERFFFSNHVMINSERTKRFVPPLLRNPKLDEIAREHAARMAQWNGVHHVRDPASLYDRIHCNDDEDDFSGRNASSLPLVADESCHRLGENISRGRNLREIHESMMSSTAERNNILDRRFLSIGVGTALAGDGTLYLCQIFSG
jgi:hypothetical protein